MATETGEHGGGEGGLAIDPMHQFEIKRLINLDFGGFDASFTNASLAMVAIVGVVAFVLLFGSKKSYRAACNQSASWPMNSSPA